MLKEIDALLDYVKSHTRHDPPDYGDRLEKEFEPLDSALYLAALRYGCADALPRKDTTLHDPDMLFFGRCNVPGWWIIRPDEPVKLTMIPTQGWVADMRTLRAVAEAKEGVTTDAIPLKEQVLSVLSKKQQAIMEFLWRKSTATFGVLTTDVPGAFAAGVTDGAITQQVKRINVKLEAARLPVSLSISGERVNLDRPTE